MDRNAFLLALIEQLGEINGKKSLQKLVYLARAFGIETGYSFRFHYYGPYSDSLAADFEQLLEGGQVSLIDNSKFKYKKTDSFPKVTSAQMELDTDEQTKLQKLLEDFGDKSPSELELYATIYFIDHNEKYVLGNYSEEEVLMKTQKAKPRYSPEKIKQAYNELNDKGLLYMPKKSLQN